MKTLIQCQPGDRVRVNLSGQIAEADVLTVWADGVIGVKTADYPFEMVVFPGEVVEKLAAQTVPAQVGEGGNAQA